ncbi:hypothetical protein ACFY3G_14905 [Streptomyces phaeochromogenes]|uniref:hypothetical protein n=1 Tax=Streptomyces phaeochromogenes TaxID=1923 RepID=UPI0036BC9A26
MDWKWIVTAVLPVMTLVLGAWLNQLNEGRREAAALKREEKLRQLDREQSLIDRRETFELTHLAEVNDLLSRLFTAALRCHEHVEAGEPLGEDGGALMGVNREIARVKGLVIDDRIRGLVEAAHRHANQLSMSSGTHITETAEAYAQVEAAQTAIAARLRDIYGSGAHPERSLLP